MQLIDLIKTQMPHSSPTNIQSGLIKTDVLLDYETHNGRRGLGDVLISTPIIEALYYKYNTSIDIILRQDVQPLLKNNPYIKNIHTNAEKVNANLHLILGCQLESYYNPRNRQPRVDSMADLFHVSLENKKPQLYYQKQKKIPNSIGVSIESTCPNRKWRYDYLCCLVRLVKANWHVFGTNYVKLPKEVKNHLGTMNLEHTILHASRMERFITVDSFFSHLAAALDIPSVVLYTTVPPEWRMKYYPQAIAVPSKNKCSPCWDKQAIRGRCYSNCADNISVEMVKEALFESFMYTSDK